MPEQPIWQRKKMKSQPVGEGTTMEEYFDKE